MDSAFGTVPPYTGNNITCYSTPMHSVVCKECPYGPKTAVFLVHQRVSEGSHSRLLDGTELRQNDKACCPVRKPVSNRVAPTVPTPAVETICLPDSQHPTRTKTHNDIPNGPTMAVPSFSP
jgi:hypothetical protein